MITFKPYFDVECNRNNVAHMFRNTLLKKNVKLMQFVEFFGL